MFNSPGDGTVSSFAGGRNTYQVLGDTSCMLTVAASTNRVPYLRELELLGHVNQYDDSNIVRESLAMSGVRIKRQRTNQFTQSPEEGVRRGIR